MAKRRIEDELQQIAGLRQCGPTEAVQTQLAKALKDKVNLIVAKAASVASDLQMAALLPDLRAAYDRLFLNPVKSDTQCWGKNALVKALKTLGCKESEPFLRGVRFQQMEPVWGGQIDTAVQLRGSCALALVQCTDIPAHQILTCLVDSLADDAVPARQDAVQGLAQWASAEAILLLRLKARLGDSEPSVTGNILDAMLRLEGETAISFVASFLNNSDEAIQEEAALALASCKLELAIAVLHERWQKKPSDLLIRAFAASRLPSALEHLLDIICSGRLREAESALAALQARPLSNDLWRKVSQAVSTRDDSALQTVFDTTFPPPESD